MRGVAAGAESATTLSMPCAPLPPPPATRHPPPATRTRQVWDNPVIWREIATWAYGRKILVIRLAYLVLFALAAGSLVVGGLARRAAHAVRGADGPGAAVPA